MTRRKGKGSVSDGDSASQASGSSITREHLRQVHSSPKELSRQADSSPKQHHHPAHSSPIVGKMTRLKAKGSIRDEMAAIKTPPHVPIVRVVSLDMNHNENRGESSPIWKERKRRGRDVVRNDLLRFRHRTSSVDKEHDHMRRQHERLTPKRSKSEERSKFTNKPVLVEVSGNIDEGDGRETDRRNRLKPPAKPPRKSKSVQGAHYCCDSRYCCCC